MGLKLAADFDLELFFSELDKRQAARDEQLRRYLQRPHGNLRQLVQNVSAAVALSPQVLDLGAPAGGLLWSVQQVCLMYGTTVNSAALGSASAAIFVGGVPQDVAHAVDFSTMVAAPLGVPVNYQAGGKSIICRSQQHIWLLLVGTGVNGQGFTVTATVLEVPDTAEALLWL